MNPILWLTRPHVPDHHANSSTTGLRYPPVQTCPDTYSNFSSSPLRELAISPSEDQPSLGWSEESFNSTPSLDLYAPSHSSPVPQYTPPDGITSLEDSHNSQVLSSNLQPNVSLSPRSPTHNEPSPTYHCSQCDKVFDKFYLRNRHYNRKHNRRYPCEVPGCQQIPFALKADLVRHRKSRHPELFPPSLFPCTFPPCQFTHKPFSRKDNLRRHIQKNHN